MMTYGHSTLVDLLSWIVAVALGLKVAATLALLSVGKDARDRPKWGAGLWWTTKIAPVVAVPCIVWMAWVQDLTDQLRLFRAMMLFVVVAVPLKVRRRRTRMANRVSIGPRA